MNLTTPRDPRADVRMVVDQIRVRIGEAEAEGFDHEQSLMIGAAYVAGRHGIGVARVGKLIDLLDRDTDRMIRELDELLRARRVGF